MEKIIQYKYLLIIIVFVILGGAYYSYKLNTESNTDGIYTGRNYEEEFACPFKDNVSFTECLIKNLDRLSATREWKQNKLEEIKYPEIGSELLSYLKEDSFKIKKWRENFENARDLKCNASVVYWYGSGSPGSVASCSIEEEISALKILDKNYYLIIMSELSGSKGIPDFEPTEQDIQKLMETNKTTRENCCGGIW